MRTLTLRGRPQLRPPPDGKLLALSGALAILASLALMLVIADMTATVPGWPPCDDQPAACPDLAGAAAGP